MVDTYDVWLERQNETLTEDVGTALVALTTILVGIPVGTAVARTITKIIDTINELRNDRKFSEANTLAKKSLEKYKHLNKDNLQEEEASGEATSNLAGPTESSGPYLNHGKKEKRKTLKESVEETVDDIFEGVGLATSGMTRHKLTVHISDPDAPQHTPREKVVKKKPMIVVAAGHQSAIEKARKSMQDKGYKVHDVEHHGEVNG